ncbi:MAG TPA: 4-alpha-glucanotransferase, partial [Terriglobales bacterium]
MLHKRSSGILMHPTSLPSRGGIGDLGPAAYEFVDWLAAAKQTLWQILPF